MATKLGTNGTIVSVVFIAAAFVFGIVVTGRVDDSSTPLISTVLGFVSVIVVTLLNGTRMEKQVTEVDSKVDKVLNGTMDEKIRRVVTECLYDVLTEHLTDDDGNGSVTGPLNR